jgi:hypothetical protein
LDLKLPFLTPIGDFMSFLQGIPESVQLLLLGSAFIFAGVLFRRVRNAIFAFRKGLPISPEQQPEPRQS